MKPGRSFPGGLVQEGSVKREPDGDGKFRITDAQSISRI